MGVSDCVLIFNDISEIATDVMRYVLEVQKGIHITIIESYIGESFRRF